MTTPTQTARILTKQVTKKIVVNYLLFLPRNYQAQADKRGPLLLFLHGAGERGNDLEKVKKHGPPKIVRSKPNFPFILVSPQCPENQRWSEDVVLTLLDAIIAQYRVDTDRVYLTGLSMGGFGAWTIAARHPERFAAIVPICGGGQIIDVLLAGPEKKEALRTLGVWAFHGARDPVVPVEESKRMVKAFERIGGKNVKLTVYPLAWHDSWTETYNNPALYDWLLRHRR